MSKSPMDFRFDPLQSRHVRSKPHLHELYVRYFDKFRPWIFLALRERLFEKRRRCADHCRRIYGFKPRTNPPRTAAYVNAYQRLNSAARRRELRAKAIEKYGGKCSKCGFSDIRALQFDHIHGGGTADLQKRGAQPKYYADIYRAEPGQFQLLCANCNWIKRHEKNECGKVGVKNSASMKRFWEEVRLGLKPKPTRHKKISN